MFSLCCQSQELRFLRASRRGDIRTLQNLYESGVDVATTAGKKRQENAMHKAVVYNRPEVIRLLLRDAGTAEKRAELVNAINSEGRSPLSAAAALGRDIVLAELLNCKETNVNLATNDSKTPIELAFDNHHFNTVRLLLKSPSQDKSPAVLSTLWRNLIVNDFVFIQAKSSRKNAFKQDAIRCDAQKLKELGELIKELAVHSPLEMKHRVIKLIEMGGSDAHFPTEKFILSVLCDRVNTSEKSSTQCHNPVYPLSIKQLRVE